MGSALRTYKNKKRGVTLSDGKGVGGQGRLTDLMCDKFQTYYGYAIRNNKEDTEKMISAIWAIYYHSIRGPPSESLEDQHRFCPADANTWCKYRQYIINGTSNYNGICLPYVFRKEPEPIFLRLSSVELLKGCERGLTQNANESINNIVWSRCQKRVFCGKRRYTISV